jgi:hypothetical protein
MRLGNYTERRFEGARWLLFPGPFLIRHNESFENNFGGRNFNFLITTVRFKSKNAFLQSQVIDSKSSLFLKGFEIENGT